MDLDLHLCLLKVPRRVLFDRVCACIRQWVHNLSIAHIVSEGGWLEEVGTQMNDFNARKTYQVYVGQDLELYGWSRAGPGTRPEDW